MHRKSTERLERHETIPHEIIVGDAWVVLYVVMVAGGLALLAERRVRGASMRRKSTELSSRSKSTSAKIVVGLSTAISNAALAAWRWARDAIVLFTERGPSEPS